MDKSICCISAKADWYESSKLCKTINEKFGIFIDVLNSDGTVQDYDVIIYVHSSKSNSDQIVNKWLKEASDLNKSFLPVVLGGSWISNKTIIANYGGPNLRTNFLQLYKEEDLFDFYNRLASFAGVRLNGDVIGAEVTLVADKDCKVYRNNECIANLQSGVPYVVTLYTGNHKLLYKANEDENIQHVESISVSSITENYNINASFHVPSVSTNEDVVTNSSSSNKNVIIFILAAIIVLGGVCFYASNRNNSTTSEEPVLQEVSTNYVVEDSVVDEDEVIKDFITKMYNEGLYEDYNFLEKHCTRHLLKQLEDDYEYDTDETAYAVWDFRTSSQDGKPDNELPNSVISVESSGDGWYTYEFIDGGWRGKHRIKAYVQDGEVMMDALERLYDECAESGQQSFENEKERVLALLETDGKHILTGYVTNNNTGYNSEQVKISFVQEEGMISNCIYFNDGVWDEHRGERVEMHGIRTAEGYHLENDDDYDDLIIDVTLKDTSFKGYVKRNNEKLSIDLNLE